MNNNFLGLIILSLLFLISSPSSFSSEEGIIKNLYPPHNDGTFRGTGLAEEVIDGVAQGRPYISFSTPQDVVGELKLKQKVTFDKVSGNKISSVKAKRMELGRVLPIGTMGGFAQLCNCNGGGQLFCSKNETCDVCCDK